MGESGKTGGARGARLSSVANATRLVKAFSDTEYEIGISNLARRLGLDGARAVGCGQPAQRDKGRRAGQETESRPLDSHDVTFPGAELRAPATPPARPAWPCACRPRTA